MHELAIAQGILDSVLTERARRNLAQIDEIGVQIGDLSGVFADALQFSFDAIRMGTPLENSQLVIEKVPTRVRCANCDSESEVKHFLFICPRCSSTSVSVMSGYELEIAYLDIPDSEEAALLTQTMTTSNG